VPSTLKQATPAVGDAASWTERSHELIWWLVDQFAACSCVLQDQLCRTLVKLQVQQLITASLVMRYSTR
jgi:hypothetical protein